MGARKRNIKPAEGKKSPGKQTADNVPTQSSRIWILVCIIIGCSILFYVQLDVAQNISKQVEGVRFRPGPAIVTTWKGVDKEWAKSWIQYHAAVGFTRMFIFWDSPATDRATIDWLNSDPLYNWVVDNWEPDDEYKRKYWMPNATSDDFEQWVLPAYGVHAETEITARQSLFVVRAAQVGMVEGVSWLLHIDADELFWVDMEKDAFAGSAGVLFEKLSSKKFTHASFMNDEIMPESANYADKNFPFTPFHQRTLFKRSSTTTFSQDERAIQGEWKQSREVNFFMGYMCGKGAINLPEYKARNPGKAVVPQHVVRFASDYRNLGLQTYLKEFQGNYEHFVVPPSKYMSAAHFYTGRIIHYINSDLNSARAKFGFREQFVEKIFDENLATDEVKERYKIWKKNWTLPEEMPSQDYYYNMWYAVQQEKKTKGNQAEVYYKKTSVLSGKSTKQRYINSGAVYRSTRIRDFIVRVDKDVNAAGINAPVKLKGLNAEKPKFAKAYYSCKNGPNYNCDHRDCCFHLRSPMFTFEKRLLGYIRHRAFEWWPKDAKI